MHPFRSTSLLRIAAKACWVALLLPAAGCVHAANSLSSAALALPNGTGSPAAINLDAGWRLWLDTQAPWKTDDLFVPDQVDLSRLPVNPPTGGWAALGQSNGLSVNLPATVEQYYWGRQPLPVANPAKPQDVVKLNSPYQGVSWWYRNFTPPALQPGEKLLLHFPGARLRAEVYVNQKLVGYNIISEIPFVADATAALLPGQTNQLAVRITNPGGTFSWGDYSLFKWGRFAFPETHGFGGLAGGVTLSVQGPVAVTDLFVANHPDPCAVTLQATVMSSGPAYHGPLGFAIAQAGKTVWSGTVNADVPSGAQVVVTQDVRLDHAELWDLRHPVLYRARAGIGSIPHSELATDFGFRWFNAEGFGANPRLVLNGRRIFVSSAISWGYWAPNGLFPDADATQREIDAVNALGLNCVQNHRHFPKAAILDAFDHAGLLRYCEPGGGSAIWDESSGGGKAKYTGPIVPSGQGGEPVTFANRYELAKLLAMVKAYRSHPSVILWSLNNETGSDSRNPKIFYALEKARELDPSRIIILKSGFAPDGEIMARPYTNTLAWGDYGKSPDRPDSGWHDIHNEDDAGVYQDSLYLNSTNFKCYSKDTAGIAMWGELGTANSPDDDAATSQWYARHRLPGYDRAAAEARLAAYEKFLDKYQFRAAFPTAQALFQAVGARHYFAAARITENARIADANDYIALTGWESTTIDNNSGLVDALRHLKGDPAPLKLANAPALLVLRPHHYVVARGTTVVFDAFLVNELNLRGPHRLHLEATLGTPRAKPIFATSCPVDLAGGEVFGQLLRDNISFQPAYAGPLTLHAWLSGPDEKSHLLDRTEPMLVVDPVPQPLTNTVACIDGDGTMIPALQHKLDLTATPFAAAAPRADVILACSTSMLYNKKEHFHYDWAAALAPALDQVRQGSRLVLLGFDAEDVGSAAQYLADQHILSYSGTAGFDDTPWIGHWYFSKKHWLLNGLPSDCVLDWQYQAAAGGDGLVLDAPGLEAAIGYGRNPGPSLGLGAAVVHCGKGEIVFLAIPGLNAAFVDGNAKGFQPVTATRLLYNALAPNPGGNK